MNILYIVSFLAPFVLLALFSVKHLQSATLGEYFLVDKRVDYEGFYKNSIGYSLQITAIFLFFYWGFMYGLKAFFLPLSWTVSLFVMAKLIELGKYAEFFDDSRRTSPTLHGYLKEKLVNGNSFLGKLTVLQITIATTLAIGSFLLFEVDYASKYLFQAIQFVPSAAQEYGINVGIILFVTALVTLGGFKIAIETDRKLTPFAYIGFSIFSAFLLLFTLKQSASVSLAASVLLTISGGALLYTRSRTYTVSKISLAAYSTTLSVSVLVLILSLWNLSSYSWKTITDVFWPNTEFFMGFGLIGVVSLVIGNITFLLSEVVMLQRNQSFFDGVDTKSKTEVLKTTGTEMGLGWFIILVIGALLRSITPDGNIVVFMTESSVALAMTCIFLFSVSIFMLSTINSLVSSLGYITYFDIISINKKTRTGNNKKQLLIARIASFIIVLALYILYIFTKEAVGKDNLALIITSLYGFQFILTAPVLLILFSTQKASKLALAVSTFVAFYVSYYSAFGTPFKFIPTDSWYVISQGAVILTGFVTYFLTNSVARFWSKS